MKTKTAMQGWKRAMRFILERGEPQKTISQREYFEFANLIVDVEDVETDIDEIFMELSRLPISYPTAEELKRFILNKTAIPGFSYTYGKRIFAYSSQAINQIDEFIIPLLKENPSSKRAIVTLWEPQKDAKAYKKDTPSFIFMQFRLRNGKIHASAVTRSMDFLYGWPSHLYQVMILQEYVKEHLPIPLELGPIATITTNAVLFREHEGIIRKIITE